MSGNHVCCEEKGGLDDHVTEKDWRGISLRMVRDGLSEEVACPGPCVGHREFPQGLGTSSRLLEGNLGLHFQEPKLLVSLPGVL